MKPPIEYNFDLKIQRDEQNLQKQKARNSANTKLFWGKFLPRFEDKQWTADCWPWSAPIVDSVEMSGNRSSSQQPLFDMLQNKVNRYSEQSISITFVTFAHDRLCDP